MFCKVQEEALLGESARLRQSVVSFQHCTIECIFVKEFAKLVIFDNFFRDVSGRNPYVLSMGQQRPEVKIL
jgi:hypothetical protein